jgi:hypothetical protein
MQVAAARQSDEALLEFAARFGRGRAEKKGSGIRE